MGFYFTEATYLMLRDYLLNDTEKQAFDDFFDPDPTTGNYVCNNYDRYSAWLLTIDEDPSNSPFTAWADLSMASLRALVISDF